MIETNENGIVKYVFSDGTGVAYWIPRASLDACENMDDMRRAGVYFLFEAPGSRKRCRMYVGQAGRRETKPGLWGRLDDHCAKSDAQNWWDEAVAFTTLKMSKFSYNHLTGDELDYLEYHLYDSVRGVETYSLTNVACPPEPADLSPMREARLLGFMENVRGVMEEMGYRVFCQVTSNKGEK